MNSQSSDSGKGCFVLLIFGVFVLVFVIFVQHCIGGYCFKKDKLLLSYL